MRGFLKPKKRCHYPTKFLGHTNRALLLFELSYQLVIRFVRPNPEPIDCVFSDGSHCSPLQSNSNRVNLVFFTELFEVQTVMVWVNTPKLVCCVCLNLYLFWKFVKKLPKVRDGFGFHLLCLKTSVGSG